MLKVKLTKCIPMQLKTQRFGETQISSFTFTCHANPTYLAWARLSFRDHWTSWLLAPEIPPKSKYELDLWKFSRVFIDQNKLVFPIVFVFVFALRPKIIAPTRFCSHVLGWSQVVYRVLSGSHDSWAGLVVFELVESTGLKKKSNYNRGGHMSDAILCLYL